MGYTTAIVTAYSKYETCPNRECITASGTVATVGTTVACPREIPFYTKVIINGNEYTCHDRTHIRYNGRYDLFVGSYQEAIDFGKRRLEVKIIK